MRTNIVIDDELMEEAMRLSGCKTKRETVEEALRLLTRIKQQEERAGKGTAVERLARFKGTIPHGYDKELQKERDEWDR